jgi:hypothetical protein
LNRLCDEQSAVRVMRRLFPHLEAQNKLLLIAQAKFV